MLPMQPKGKTEMQVEYKAWGGGDVDGDCGGNCGTGGSACDGDCAG